MNPCLPHVRFGAAFAFALSVATLGAAPVITQQPADTVVTVGTPAVLSVAATGSPLRYVWFKDGVVMTGQNAATLSLPAAGWGDDGVYTAMVSERGSAVRSSAAVVTVVDAATTKIADNFSDGVIDGQWTDSGAVPPPVDPTSFSETDGRLAFVAVAPAEASERYLVNNATLPLNRQWTLTVALGLAGNDLFAGGAPGQPRCKAGMVVGVSSPSAQSDSFDCGLQVKKNEGVAVREIFSDHDRAGTRRDYGMALAHTVESAVVRLSFDPATQLLTSAYVVDGEFVPVATINPLAAWGLTASDHLRLGLRGFATRVDVPAGRVWADDFRIVVRGGPTVTTAPVAQSGVRGGGATFGVQATGEGTLAYQWYHDGRRVKGATSATLALTTLKPADVGRYYVAITDTHGTTTTPAVALTHGDSVPAITTAPSPLVATSGQPATFTVAASGAALRYQWRRDGVAIPGATTASYTLPTVTVADAGFYDVEVSSGLAAVVSSAAKLDVLPSQIGPTYRLDTSFSLPVLEMNGGTVTALARAADGCIYAAGSFTQAAGAARTNLARFTADLQLDAGFAPQVDGSISQLVLQKDGKLVIAGVFTTVGGQACDGIARIKADGTLDTTYNVPVGVGGRINAMVLDAADRVLLGGWFELPGYGYTKVVRLNADGTLDTSFSTVTAISNSVGCLAVDEAGRILVGEYWFSTDTGKRPFVRLLPDGTIDPAFTFSPAVSTWGSGQFLSILPQGDKVVVGGSFSGPWDPRVSRGLFRLNSDGSLDSGFSGDMGQPSGWGLGIAALGDGRLAVRSYFGALSGSNIHILSADGVVDPTYFFGLADTQSLFADYLIGDGAGGLLLGGVLAQSGGVTCLSRWDSDGGALGAAAAGWRQVVPRIQEVAPAPGGGWYLAGPFVRANGQPAAGVLRLRADGSVDPSFAPVAPAESVTPNRLTVTGGLVYITASSGRRTRLLGYDASGALVVDSLIGSGESPTWLKGAAGGKLLVAGSPTHLAGFGQRRIARFDAEGGIDLGFDIGRGPDAAVNSLALGGDDRLLLGGHFAAFDGAASKAIARLLPNGALDTTYSSPIGSGSVYTLFGVLDGSALVFGSFSLGETYQYGLVRLTPSGAQDSAYLAQGGINSSFLGLPDGRVLAGGSFSDAQNRMHPMILLKPDGTRDDSFDVFDLESTGTVKAVDDDGRILLLESQAKRAGIARTGVVMLKPDVSPVATIAAQPVSQVATAGQNVTFSVTATGDDLTYQWSKDGVAIDGATSPSLLVSSVQTADLGTYKVTVSNSWGSVTSTAVTLSGTGTAPTITQSPGEVVATSGTSATFTVAAAGSGPLSYQWRRMGVPIAGATSATYTIPSVEMADAGFYDVVVYDGLAPTTSTAGQLFVQPRTVADTYRLDTSFTPIFERAGGCVNALAEASDGAVYAGGEFTMIAGLPQRYLARFDRTLAVDPTFRPVLDGQVYAILPQADGRVVIGGSFSSVNGMSRNRIARLNPNGSLDESFDPVISGGEIRALATANDGTILVAGSFWAVDGVSHSGVVRLTADGVLDSTFAAPAEIGGNTVVALALQADGKVLMGGWFSSPTLGNRIARLNSDGSIDSSFATGTGADAGVYSIVCQSDGRIVVGGAFSTFAGTTVGRIVRLEPNGAIDPTFAAGAGFNWDVDGLAHLPDGRIAVGGSYSSVGGAYQFGFAVLTASGVRDTSFAAGANLSDSVNALTLVSGGRLLVGGRFSAEGGVATSGLVAYSSNTGVTAARTAAGFRSDGNVDVAIPVQDNKWMVGGYFAYVNGVPRSCLVRLNADGTVDSSFAAGSLLYNDVRAMVEQGDGKLLVASWQSTYGHLLRFNPDGSRDDSFSGGTGFDQTPTELALLPDGRIVAAGFFTTFAGSPCGGAVILGRDGARDTTFVPGTGFDSTVYSLVAQPDGRLILGGTFSHYDGNDVGGVVRLNGDGTVHSVLASHARPDGGVYTLAVQPEGRTLLGGTFVSLGGTSHIYRGRLTSDFAVDSTYGSDHSVITNSSVLVPLSDGRAWTTDWRYVPHCFDVQRLGRLTATGSIDQNLRTFDLLSTAPNGILQAEDGRLLLVGASASRDGSPQSGLVMLKPDASPLPQIVATVGGGTVQIGDSVTLSATVTGEGPLTYIWRHDGVVIDAAVGPSLTIDAVDHASAGTYSVEVSNSYGWAEASMALSLQPQLSIVTQPSDVSIDLGQSISLSVAATGGDSLTYQWYRGECGDTSVPVTFGANGSMLPLLLPQTWARYWVRVTMGTRHVDSRTALVRVNGGTMTLADWTLLPGTPADQRGAFDTPAGDGVCNLLKFALGVAPMDLIETRWPRAVIVTGQGTDRFLALEFTRNTLAQGVAFDLDISSDLKSWDIKPSAPTVVGPVGAGLERVRLCETAPLGGVGRRFARLVVRVAP